MEIKYGRGSGFTDQAGVEQPDTGPAMEERRHAREGRMAEYI
ncbi:hypothetical protein [Pedococcus sp. 5OH_020]|nr:hypothetical protein [Pedococcus sp. 5OH_020]